MPDETERYTPDEAREEAEKMQEEVKYGRAKDYDEAEANVEKSLEQRKTPEAEERMVAAITKFQDKDELKSYIEALGNIDLARRADLRKQYGITFGDSRFGLGMNQFFEADGKRVYASCHRYLGDALKDNLPVLGEEPKYHAEREAPGTFYSTEYQYYLAEKADWNSMKNLSELPKEIIQAMLNYEEWFVSDTGKYLDAAVEVGQISEDQAKAIRNELSNKKRIMSNAGQVNSSWNSEVGNVFVHNWDDTKQIYWKVGEPKEEG